jgi:hypothetical protein
MVISRSPTPFAVDVDRVRRRARLLMLLDAAERAGIAPLASTKLHAFAYLADVLSPVWDLIPFDGKIYKSEGGPHYPDLQLELDRMVALGLVQISHLRFIDRGPVGARIDGLYALNFGSEPLAALLAALGCDGPERAIDPGDADVHAFLVELAGALATLPDDQIDVAAGVDVTYGAARNLNNVVDFADWAEDKWQANASWRAAERFHTFMPKDASLSPGEKLYLYATYLGRAIHAA